MIYDDFGVMPHEIMQSLAREYASKVNETKEAKIGELEEFFAQASRLMDCIYSLDMSKLPRDMVSALGGLKSGAQDMTEMVRQRYSFVPIQTQSARTYPSGVIDCIQRYTHLILCMTNLGGDKGEMQAVGEAMTKLNEILIIMAGKNIVIHKYM